MGRILLFPSEKGTEIRADKEVQRLWKRRTKAPAS
jgi:hypothetical protein